MSSIFYDEKDLHDIAQIKRFMEILTMVPGAKEEYEKDPEGFLLKNQVPFSREDLQFKMADCTDLRSARAVHPGAKIKKYIDFTHKKLDWRDALRESSTPQNSTMKKWRDRQIVRCEGAFGYRNHSYIHTVLTMELTSGCSVGCSYCGLNAGKLSKIYRATPENLEEWGEILAVAKEVIGDGAGYGTCYYATELMDNPDYEKFVAVYREVFGRLPQITTAAALRNKERTRKLLQDMMEEGDTIYRFSVQSLEQLEEIRETFTPEELILVELLPQYKEAPGSHFVKAGRNAQEEYEGTIACLTGFVINMAEHTIRLTTPVTASERYPTGEAVLCQESFADAEDLRRKMQDMIRTHMKLLIGPKEKIQLYPYFDYTVSPQCVKIISKEHYMIQYDKPEEISGIREILPLLKEGKMTKRELVDQLQKEEEKWGVKPEFLFYFLNYLWKQGLLVDHDLYPED